MDAVDVLIVGAGHNGLVAALMLARAGLQVRRFVSLIRRDPSEIWLPKRAPRSDVRGDGWVHRPLRG
ncbi:MAG: FAD-binding protein, partial [Myxococcales bacterium]|nr:FAD-binding protein [Myxococcales bacterium]